MEASHDREIDWEIARLRGGLSAARRAQPAHQGSLQPSDWDLDEEANGPLSERGEALERDLAPFSEASPRRRQQRPIAESIAPMSMESSDPEGRAALPSQEIVAERKRPSGATQAVWVGVAGAMSVLALGLVLKAGLDATAHASAARGGFDHGAGGAGRG